VRVVPIQSLSGDDVVRRNESWGLVLDYERCRRGYARLSAWAANRTQIANRAALAR
jgi:hypothetical protein